MHSNPSSVAAGIKLDNTAQPADNVCPICAKVLINRTQMRKHFKEVHLKEKKYECQFCHKFFTQACTRKRHVVTMHSDMMTAE